MKTKIISIAFTLLLIFSINMKISAEPIIEVWVNGENILTASDNTVLCGDGRAVYDLNSKTLTLENATISSTNHSAAISTEGFLADEVLTIILKGTNKIDGPSISNGIYVFGNLSIEGTGTLDIKTRDTGNGIFGIFAFESCKISSNVSLHGLKDDDNTVAIAIDVNGWLSSFMCEDANIEISGYMDNINVPSGYVNIKNSNIVINDGFYGINGGLEIDNFKIENSYIYCAVSGEPKVLDGGVTISPIAISNGYDIDIDHSTLILSNTTSNAIFSNTSINIYNDSNIDATAYFPALFSNVSTNISDSKVKAIATNDFGIFSKGAININNSEVYAKGGSGYGAIAARAVKAGDEEASTKITLLNVKEKNGAKIACTDWFLHSGGQTRSWTSFIGKDATAIELNASNAMTNAINEIWIEKEIPSCSHDFEDIYIAASCTESGLSYSQCRICGTRTEANIIPATGHIFTAWTKTGDIDIRFCNVCNHTETRAAEQTTHTHVWQSDFTIDKAPSCTENGSKSIHCVNCAEVKDVTAIPATGHTESDWIIDKAASYDEEGSRHTECTVCLQVLKTETIAKLSQTSIIIDNTTPISNGISIEYEDGSLFEDDVQLIIKQLHENELSEVSKNIIEDMKELRLVNVFDIKMLKNGLETQPDGNLRISITLSEEMMELTNLLIVYIDDNGNVTIIPSEIIDGKIVFTTSHFSYYGIIGKAKSNDSDIVENPPTSDSLNYLSAILFISALSVSLIILNKKRTNNV